MTKKRNINQGFQVKGNENSFDGAVTIEKNSAKLSDKFEGDVNQGINIDGSKNSVAKDIKLSELSIEEFSQKEIRHIALAIKSDIIGNLSEFIADTLQRQYYAVAAQYETDSTGAEIITGFTILPIGNMRKDFFKSEREAIDEVKGRQESLMRNNECKVDKLTNSQKRRLERLLMRNLKWKNCSVIEGSSVFLIVNEERKEDEIKAEQEVPNP